MICIRQNLMAATLLTLASLGCNKSPQATYPVHGAIKWGNGQVANDLAEATVELQVVEGPQIRVSPRGEVQSDGTFTLTTYSRGDGAPAGTYKAIVMPKQVVDDEIRAPPPILHKRFQSFPSTPLQIKVDSGANDIVLQVEHPSSK
jgi:hypothetical protein